MAIAFWLFTGAFAETKAQGVLNTVLTRMNDHNKALTSLKANISMDKHNPQLGETDSYVGKVIYLPQKGRNAFVRIDWSKPVVESLAVVNKEYLIYRSSTNQVFVGNVDKAKGGGVANNPLSFINMSKAELKANFDIKYIGQETANGTQTWHLELTPLKAGSFKKADIWVDGNGMPIQMKVVEKNDDTTAVVLSNLEKNKTIKGSDFKINYPKNAAIVKQ